MAFEFFELQSIDLENTVVRNPRVGARNRPTSRTIDVGATGPGATGVYTGERDVSTEYLVQGSVNGDIIKASSASFTLNSKLITNVTGINGLQPSETLNPGDIVRADGDIAFYTVTGMGGITGQEGLGTVIFLSENNTTVAGINSLQVRKIKLDSTHFEYIISYTGQNKFYYDKTNRNWGYSGTNGFTGPVIATSSKENYFENDPVTFQFYSSNSSTAPDVTSIDTTASDPKQPYGLKVLNSKLAIDTPSISLNPIPYPDDDENFRVYWGPQNKISLKTKDIDYTVNYTMDPDYTSAKPPYKDRNVAYVKFLKQLNDTTQVDSIGLGFQGVFNLHQDPTTSATKTPTAITNIYPNAKGLTIPGSDQEYSGEIIRVGKEVKQKNFDYNIEYDNGIVNFIKHSSLELDVPNVLYNQKLIWDGISVIKGVGLTGLVSPDRRDCVLPYAVSGLTGIDGPVFFEDVDANDLVEGTDYIIAYNSGAVKLTKPLKANECVLVSYFVKGEAVTNEPLNLNVLRTSEYPVIESSVTIKKTYSNTSTSTSGISILVEGVDFSVSYLTGKITLLNSIVGENLSSLQISYTPFAQVQCILQPDPADPTYYRITILDDVMDIVDPFNLKFKIDNPTVSTPVKDPFGEAPTTYNSSIIPGSVFSVKGIGKPGYGFDSLTPDQMISIGMTGLEIMGLAKLLGQTDEEFYALGITGVLDIGVTGTQYYDAENYTYDDVSKQLQLDGTLNANKPKPDINDVITSSYTYVADVLPYAPVQMIFPVLDQATNTILIEGFDKTDVIYPGMTFRIDNSDPRNTYYFIVFAVSYDGLNTLITLKGSFSEDIRNPSFYLFDDILEWYPLPTGATIDSSATVGSDTITIKGSALKSLDLLRPKTLMMIEDKNVYEILTTTVVDNETLNVKIFPNLLNEYPKTIKISEPVYQVGDTTLNSEYPIITDPEHPAFTIRYVAPANAIYGFSTIFIDTEQITLTETVDNQSTSYSYSYSDYDSIYDLAQDINNTVSTLDPSVYQYNPFTLESAEGVVQYYLGTGFWDADLVIPFEQDSSVVIPTEGYTVTIIQEVFRYILIKATKGISSFLVERKDRTDYFQIGNLLAFTSKTSGNTSFYEVSNVEAIYEQPPSGITGMVDTKVSFIDSFRENMVAPYMYKFDDANWIPVTQAYTIDYDNSKIIFLESSDLFKIGALLNFNNGFIYKITDVSDVGTTVVLTLSPTISPSLNNIRSISASDMPIYLNETTTQPYFIINYTLPEGYSGGATVSVDGNSITLTEKLDGYAAILVTAPLPYSKSSNLDNLSQFGDALDRLSGNNFLGNIFVDTSAYDPIFIAGGKKLKLVPTNGTIALSASIAVSRPIFEINYTAPDATVDGDVYIPNDGSNTIQLSEWKKANKARTLVTYSVSYEGVSVTGIIGDMLSIPSLITGHNAWYVFNTDYDPYYGTEKPFYYNIIPFADQNHVTSATSYGVQATENPVSWYSIPILNRNVLVEGTDYNIEGTQVVLTNPIQPRERYEVSYLGIDDLADSEGESIKCSCRYFSSIPAGDQISVYMDYLNPDQYYIQKLTERAFLEVVTVPQIQDILQQAGNSAGMGNSSGSDDIAQNYQGGLVDLYYLLKDEQIKQQIYLKIFQWYKHRLRNFAAEAQVTMGIKYGHSNHVGYSGMFTMQDQYVEDNNYTLTKASDFDQLKNGFSKFFPVGYDDPEPMKYPRFTDTYQSYNEVFCYNIEYHDKNDKFVSKEGRIISANPYWADAPQAYGGIIGSVLDFDILPYTQNTSVIAGGTMYPVPYNQLEKHLSVNDENYKFLRRISVEDSVQLLGFQNTYKIAKVEEQGSLPNGAVPINYVVDKAGFSAAGVTGVDIIPMTYDGVAPTQSNPNPAPGTQPVYGIYANTAGETGVELSYAKIGEDYPLGTPVIRTTDAAKTIIGIGYKVSKPIIPFDRLILDGASFTESGIPTFVVKPDANGVYTYYYYTKDYAWAQPRQHSWTLLDLEVQLPKDGQNIIVTREPNKDYPVLFPAWDDEYNLGTKVVGSKIVDQKTGTDTIRKAFSFEDLFSLDDEDKLFTVYEGTYNDLTGLWEVKQTISVNLKYLNYFDERSVSRVVDSIKYNVTGVKVPFPLPPFFLEVSKVFKKKDNLGTDRLFYVSFDKYYDASLSGGYGESIVMRTKDRNSWVQYDVTSTNSPPAIPLLTDSTPAIAPEYGFKVPDVYTNFYYPNNLFLKLLIEKQIWLTELNIIKDIFDTNNKLKRAFSVDIQDIATIAPGKSEFQTYLSQVAEDSTLDNIESSINSYRDHLTFLLNQSDTVHKYLVDNTSGPLYRTMMENNITLPIQNSYLGATGAQVEYTAFQAETNNYYNLNDYYYQKWQTEYEKWALSLEAGSVFQKDARDKFNSAFDINIGFSTFPAIKMTVIDQGANAPFTISDAKYLVSYNIIETANTSADEYDDATLIVAYLVSGDTNYTFNSFVLKNYPTLQALTTDINSKCVHPTLGAQFISATSVFNYYPYSNYSSQYILRTYRNVANNDSNGTDFSSGDGWTVLSTDTSADDRIYVSNVLDHRRYDARVFFMNRIDFKSDYLSIDGANYHAFPYYLPGDSNSGKDILGENKAGLIAVSGKWSENAYGATEIAGIDYTTAFSVMTVAPALPSDTFVQYEFLDYVRGPEQISGEETPRNPTFEKSQADLTAIGYDEVTKTLSERYPSITGPYDKFAPTGPDNSNYDALLDWATYAQGYTGSHAPETEVVRDLQIELMSQDFTTPNKFNKIFFTFDLRQYPTINDLIKALNTTRFTVTPNSDGVTYTAKPSTGASGSIYFSATLIGSKDLQGTMKTVDLITNYVRQEVYVSSYTSYTLGYTYTDMFGETGVPAVIPSTVSMNKSFPVGWQLREQNSLSTNTQLNFNIDPRTYSPSYFYRFIPDRPDIARTNTFLTQKEDILAFDLYSWDTNAQYKIKDNVLYLKSDSVAQVSIPLYKTQSLDNSIEHPEETNKLIDVIRAVNNNTLCNKKFFANLRFGRLYNSDFQYTYFPDTALWVGGDGWVTINQEPSLMAKLDYLYLDKDRVLSVYSEGANFYYEVDPYPVSYDSNTVYNTSNLILSADTKAFSLGFDSIDYNSASATYDVDQTSHTMTLTGHYDTTGGLTGTIALYTTVQDLATYINSNPAFTATPVTGFAGDLLDISGSSFPCTFYLPGGFTGMYVDVNPDYTGTFFSIASGKISLDYIYHNTLVSPVNLLTSTNLNAVISQINGIGFFNANLSWYDDTALSSTLLDTGGTISIPSSGAYVRMHGVINFGLSSNKTISALAQEINNSSSNTGFSVDTTTADYLGYQNMRSDLLIPTNGNVIVPSDHFIWADFRSTPGVYILNMSHTTEAVGSSIGPAGEHCTTAIAGNVLTFTKLTSALTKTGSNYIGDYYEYDGLGNKNIQALFSSAMSTDGYYLNTSSPNSGFAYASGSLKMDVALLPVPGINYGKLRLAGGVNSMSLAINDPEVLNTHVYLGFLGDINFYQISDYNLWKQYVLVKRRLGMSWDQSAIDYYVPDNLYSFGNYEYTLNLVENGKFLYYLKYTRFNQLATSLSQEDLYNNKYMWVYLKSHKELGCDQKVIALQKKIKSDSKKALLLQ